MAIASSAWDALTSLKTTETLLGIETAELTTIVKALSCLKTTETLLGIETALLRSTALS